ncbi:hypothetical protein XENTR_v10000705 [Xenopus tropicalis]|nr:hypothetical protein XENTR_v10000705 [Xenopus tropicalis]
MCYMILIYLVIKIGGSCAMPQLHEKILYIYLYICKVTVLLKQDIIDNIHCQMERYTQVFFQVWYDLTLESVLDMAILQFMFKGLFTFRLTLSMLQNDLFLLTYCSLHSLYNASCSRSVKLNNTVHTAI